MKSTSLPKKAACVGAGIIGSSWALLFAIEGGWVVVYNAGRASLERSKSNIREMLSDPVGDGGLTARSAAPVMSRISPTSDLGSVSDRHRSYVQESVTENLAVQRRSGSKEGGLRDGDNHEQHFRALDHAAQRGLLPPGRSLHHPPVQSTHVVPLVDSVPSEKSERGP